MTMLRLKPRQRAVIVEKLPDLANIIAWGFRGRAVGRGATGVAVPDGRGAAIWIGLASVTLLIAGGEP
jgi:hypothetical protein